jgi:hypothetical protein
MNQKVSEAIKKDEIDLDDINSWASILQTTEKEVAKTKLARWSPKDLYILEKEDSNGFNSVWTTVPAELKVPARKLLQYLQEKHDEEKVKAQRELNAELEKELNLTRALEGEKIKKLSVEEEKTQGNSHIQNS